MTIKFHCPNCGAMIGFADQHSGKRAHCTTCQQHFIIPSRSDETPEKVNPPKEKDESIPGFYRAVLVENWRLFTGARNTTGFVFVTAAVVLKFFTGHTDYSFTMGGFRLIAPIGSFTTLVSWGCLFWYYIEIIRATAIDIEELPDVNMGGLFGFIWNVIKSLCIFAFTMLIVLLPCILYIGFTRDQGIVAHILALIGLFAFPMAILNVSLSGEIAMTSQVEHLLNLKPIKKAFWPYLVVVALFVGTWELQLRTVGYGELIGRGTFVVGFHLFCNLVVQAIALIVIRSIGLFYRHYHCYFPW